MEEAKIIRFLIRTITFFRNLIFILDGSVYESKVESFLSGYRKVRAITEKEIKLISEAGAAIFAFYLGVQAQRFDWSNIFLTENYLKMFVGRIKTWKEYYASKKKVIVANNGNTL